jgi:hypothetical protein
MKTSRALQLHYVHLTLNNPGFWSGKADEGLMRARRCVSLHIRLMHGLDTNTNAGTSPPDTRGLSRIRTWKPPIGREFFRSVLGGFTLTATGVME